MQLLNSAARFVRTVPKVWWLVVILVVIVAVVMLRRRAEGFDGDTEPPSEIAEMVKTHCATGQTVNALKRAYNTGKLGNWQGYEWKSYDEARLKALCNDGREMRSQAKKDFDAGLKGACQSGACTYKSISDVYQCKHDDKAKFPNHCCKVDKPTECHDGKAIGKANLARINLQAKQGCDQNARKGMGPSPCGNGFSVKCKRKNNSSKDRAWMCCNPLDNCYYGDWSTPVGELKGGKDYPNIWVKLYTTQDGFKQFYWKDWGNRIHHLNDHGMYQKALHVEVGPEAKVTLYSEAGKGTDRYVGKWTIKGQNPAKKINLAHYLWNNNMNIGDNDKTPSNWAKKVTHMKIEQK